VKLVDAGRGLAAGYASRMLASTGARVTRVIDTSMPRDPHRDADPAVRKYFDQSQNQIELDLLTPEGKRELKALCLDADALIDDRRPRDAEPRGLDFASLSAVNAQIVAASVTPFGTSGPYKNYRGTDAVVAFMSGLGYMNPRDMPKEGDGRSQPPVKLPGSLVSIYAGISTAGAVLSALRLRERTGKGHHVDISMVETLIPTMRRELAKYFYEGVISSRFMRVWKLAPWGIKKCRDGYVFLQIVEEHHWLGFVDMMGNPQWALDKRYLDNDYRFDHRVEIEERIAPWLLAHPKAEIAWEAQKRHVPFAAVNALRDLAHMPQLVERRFFEPYADGVLPPRLVPGAPYPA
jgi:crotonobetainyl-CoA:carnitine CoA-transferase CaiB-like acyl-CoA transferase